MMNPATRKHGEFHLLKLKDGRTAVGVQDDPQDPQIWASLFTDGAFMCLNPEEIVFVEKVPMEIVERGEVA